MSLLASLLRTRAASTGRAEAACRLRHLHLSDRPLMLIALNRTGPAARPLAVMLGTDPCRPQLHTAPPSGSNAPTLAALAQTVIAYIDTCRHTGDAPQILVPNPKSVEYLKELGDDLRLRRTNEMPGSRAIQRLGHWFTYLTDRADIPGAAALIAMTDFLGMHWITGQSPLEDEDLATLLAWIDPPRQAASGREAADQAEASATYRPPGPATDAAFDNYELAPLLQADARGQDQTSVLQALHSLLARYMQPTWDLMWHAYALLQTVPEAPSTARRWDQERTAFADECTYLAQDGRPRPAHEQAVATAVRLATMEHADTLFAAERAADDPFVRAELRTSGQAFAGPVITVDTQHLRRGLTGRALWRPRLTVSTRDPVLMEPGQLLACHTHRNARYKISEITPSTDATVVELEITAGMGTVARPNDTVLPEPGTQLVFTLAPDYYRMPEFPTRAQTPWTHGGPPPEHPNENGDGE
ncbi:hypothetical protein ACH414_32880 [Streptomyces sp. NPDC020422]|uniref:hypothetical protein n=1 Tax=Streptomyces sp. NPDC020422 TaxID=3365074 RepID=UPI0037911292